MNPKLNGPGLAAGEPVSPLKSPLIENWLAPTLELANSFLYWIIVLIFPTYFLTIILPSDNFYRVQIVWWHLSCCRLKSTHGRFIHLQWWEHPLWEPPQRLFETECDIHFHTWFGNPCFCVYCYKCHIIQFSLKGSDVIFDDKKDHDYSAYQDSNVRNSPTLCLSELSSCQLG